MLRAVRTGVRYIVPCLGQLRAQLMRARTHSYSTLLLHSNDPPGSHAPTCGRSLVGLHGVVHSLRRHLAWFWLRASIIPVYHKQLADGLKARTARGWLARSLLPAVHDAHAQSPRKHSPAHCTFSVFVRVGRFGALLTGSAAAAPPLLQHSLHTFPGLWAGTNVGGALPSH